jgi:type IV pilus assembly protein PilY1
LQITDGESTEDMDIPVELQDFDNDSLDPGEYPSNGSDYLDDVALWGQTTDLRPNLSDDLGPQNVTYYTVFAFGKGSDLLKNAAINGGFWDLNGDNRPGPDSREWDRDQDGFPDTYFEAPSGFELEKKIFQAITAILKRAASGTAVSVLSTSERGEGTMYQAFFRPRLIDDLDEVKWLGFLRNLWLDQRGNIREDTVADGRLVLAEDKIIRYRFDGNTLQTIVDRYSDLDEDSEIDNFDANGNPVPDDSLLLEDFQGSIWEAGKQLATRDPGGRTILTFADSDLDGVVDSNEQVDFITSNLSQFETFLDVVGDDPLSYSYLGDSNQRASNLIRFTRGEQINGLRNRRVTVEGSERVWKLGDIVFSTPTVASWPQDAYDRIYGDFSYFNFLNHWKNRQGMVYIGANDGMLHAFRAGRFISGDDPSTQQKEIAYLEGSDLGSEAWAYVPFNLLPHLKWLADPDYTHVFYVDLKTKVADVKIFPADQVHIDGWGTLLVGGMRLGGGPYPSAMTDGDGNPLIFQSAYFLIDVTDPENPVVLAEFTHPQMGFTTSYPTITKVQDHWYLVSPNLRAGPQPLHGRRQNPGRAGVAYLPGIEQLRLYG